LGSHYAVSAHSLSALQKGATADQIEAVKTDFDRGRFTEAQTLGLRCAERIHRSASEIDDGFFANLKQMFNDQQIIELVPQPRSSNFSRGSWMRYAVQ
jgi:alkylhydroperoxidase family enzyme